MPDRQAPPVPLTLRHLRLSCNLTQDQVAALLHIPRQTYGCYERGERVIPQELLTRCSRLYRVKPIEIIGDVESRFTMTEDEEDLLTCYRILDAEGKEQILSMIHYESELCRCV